jgi:coenzyme F420-0:L-glutamate ligase/coenzyme F420-1:gamma-L-glutamate ligase
MNDSVMEAIRGRRSIRSFEARSVPGALLDRVISAACWAPSAHNRQPWRFAVVTDEGIRQRLALAMGRALRDDLTADGAPQGVIDKDVERSYQRISKAPALILVCLTEGDMDVYPDERRQRNEWLMAVQSAAMAGQNLLLAAHAEGLGGCWMCAPLFCPDVVSRTLGLPADWQPQGLITLGYPAEDRAKSRRPLSDVVKYVGAKEAKPPHGC